MPDYVKEKTRSADDFRLSTQDQYDTQDQYFLDFLASPKSPRDFNIWVAEPDEDPRRSGELINWHETSSNIDSYANEIADALGDDKHVYVNIGGEPDYKEGVAPVISYLNKEFPETAIMDVNAHRAPSEMSLLPQSDGYISVDTHSFKNPESDESQRTPSDDTGGIVSNVRDFFN